MHKTTPEQRECVCGGGGGQKRLKERDGCVDNGCDDDKGEGENVSFMYVKQNESQSARAESTNKGVN